MTCRDEILEAIGTVLRRAGDDVFELHALLDEMRKRGTSYSESTIRTHITSRMCANAPDHHAVVYDDLVRVGHGRYRLSR
jgi:hypothetical protein